MLLQTPPITDDLSVGIAEAFKIRISQHFI
jgi:hypothetical protein